MRGSIPKFGKNDSEAPYIVQHREIRKYRMLTPRGGGGATSKNYDGGVRAEP